MKEMTLRNKNRANQEAVTEKEVSDLTVRKLTLKTGVKAGYVGGGGGETIIGSTGYPAGT